MAPLWQLTKYLWFVDQTQTFVELIIWRFLGKPMYFSHNCIHFVEQTTRQLMKQDHSPHYLWI